MIPNRRTKRRSKNVDSRLKISGMTKKGSFLNGSTRGPNNGRGHTYGSIRNPNYLRAKTSGCLIKDFRHDEKGVTPKCFYQGSAVLKRFGFPIEDFGNDGRGGRHP